MTKDIGTKRLVFSLITGALLLCFGIFFTPPKYHALPVILSFLCTAVSSLRWLVLYDRYDPNADVFGVGLTKRRFPSFIENEGKMNALAFNTYKWLIVTLVLLAC